MSEYNIQMNKYNALNAEYDQLYPATKIANVDGLGTALQKKVNPWINDNGYFGNPVNQRGKAVYTNADNYASMYGIDRWFTTGNGNKPTVNIKDGYIEFVAAGIYTVFGQKKEAKSYAGKTITLSSIAKSTKNAGLHIICFNSEGTKLSDSFTTLYSSSDFQLVQKTIDVPDSCAIFQYGFLSLAEGETTVAATAYKVEIGSQQTLAHQENGVWVLNEIPDYGEQMARCQRYFFRCKTTAYTTVIFGQTGNGQAVIRLPVAMRTAPSISNISSNASFTLIEQNNQEVRFLSTTLAQITAFDAVADL